MSTRAGIIRRAVTLARSRGLASTDGGVTALTSTSGDVTSIEDTSPGVLVRGYSTATMRNWHLSRPAAANAEDEVRLLKEFDPLSQVWRHAGPDYTAAPTTERYLILKDPPSTWNTALNIALRELLFFPRYDEFTPVSTTRRIYQIDAAPISVSDITYPGQVWNIQWHETADAANEENWKDWGNGRKTYEVYEDEGTFYIDFGRSHPPHTSQELRLLSIQPFSTLTDETTASNVNELWAAQATLLAMNALLGDPDNPTDPWTEIARRERPRYESYRRALLGKLGYRQVQRASTRIGAGSVQGRGGVSSRR